MRKIKFRMWDRRMKQMDFPDSIANDIDSERFDIMQYTGLKDKNGVDVYDGDVVKIIKPQRNYCEILEYDYCHEIRIGDIAEVFYSSCHYAVKVVCSSEFFDLNDLISDQGRLCVEVVGNVHKNSALHYECLLTKSNV